MLNVSRGDSNDAVLCRYTLQALTHLFSWVPLTPYVTPNLLSAIFHLAGSSQVTPTIIDWFIVFRLVHNKLSSKRNVPVAVAVKFDACISVRLSTTNFRT
jgi:hypothetical protein